MIVQIGTMPIQERDDRPRRDHLVISCLAIGGLATIGWIGFMLWATWQIAAAIAGTAAS
ncbi:MAG: hypothetical protein INR70_32865 [Parafilimonas terrae]|nr:hypothetical protein [Parafilimonas terrae]